MTKTLILPGFSPKNKLWAEDVVEGIKTYFEPVIIEWEHWKTDNKAPLNIPDETGKIKNLIGDAQVNVVAKSIGSLVTMHLIKAAVKFNKLILAGIPINDLSQEDKNMYQYLAEIPKDKLLCIQNDADPHGSYNQIKELLTAVSPDILLVNKPAADHDYLYSSDFKTFLLR